MPARREFLKTAGLIAVGTAAVGSTGCELQEAAPVGETATARESALDRALLDALAVIVLPASLGATGVRAATEAFAAWVDGYEPVAEEMHGYGYADVRYLPADPAPAWGAQLSALDLQCRKSQRAGFAEATPAQRTAVLEAVLRSERGERLPAPLGAPHIAIALLSHWAATPDAWNLALGAEVSPLTCRRLDDAVNAPPPIVRPAGQGGAL